MPERQLLLDGYATIPFPFDEVEAPKLTLTRTINLAQLMGYVRSWSATARFVKDNGTGEVDRLERDLASNWGDVDQPRLVRAPLHIRAGYPRAPSPS
jgi:hypothetical protein